MISNEAIYSELQEVKQLLLRVLKENSLDEVSLFQAGRLLHLSEQGVIELIEKGYLLARRVESKRSKSRYTWKVSLQSINDTQQDYKKTKNIIPFDVRKVARG